MTVLRMTDLDLRGKRVLIREDLNVPVEAGVISSDARIRAALPSLRAAVGAGARVIVMSHLGRPKEGEFSAEDSLAVPGSLRRAVASSASSMPTSPSHQIGSRAVSPPSPDTPRLAGSLSLMAMRRSSPVLPASPSARCRGAER